MQVKNKLHWLHMTYLTIGSTINLICAALLILSAYAYAIPPDKSVMASYAGLAFPVFLFINVCFVIFWLIQRRWVTLISVIALLICSNSIWNYAPIHFSKEKVTGDTLSLLTYNVHAFMSFTPHTAESPNPILSYIEESGADIVCMQEFGYGTGKNHLKKAQIDSALSAYPYSHVTLLSNTPYAEMGIACYSKYPITDYTEIKNTDSFNGSCIYKIKIKDRELTLINNHLESNKFTDGDRKFYIYAMKHLDDTELFPEVKERLINKMAEAYRKREKQAEKINQVIRETEGPLIVCGDFNDTPQSYAYRKIKGDLKDAYVSTGTGPGITYHENRFWFRIDHVLYNTDFKALDTEIGKIKKSDHYPVKAILQWSANDSIPQNK